MDGSAETAPPPVPQQTPPAERALRRPKPGATETEIVKWFAQRRHNATENGVRKRLTTAALLFNLLRSIAMSGDIRANKVLARWSAKLRPTIIEGGYLVVSESVTPEVYIRQMVLHNRFAKPPDGLEYNWDEDD